MTSHAAADAVRLLLRGPPDDLCLAFVNTNYWRGTATPTEELQTPADLAAWCEGTGLWAAEALGPVRAAAAARFAEALALRETLFRIFSATCAGSAPAADDLGTLNAALAAAPPRARLRDAGGGLRWDVPGGRMAPLAPVLWSAGDLLAGARLGRVRQCANPQCRWLFLDDSKGGTRRWCSMSACGNRAKAHRHYARRKAAQ